MAKGVAVPETAVPRFGEGGVVGDAVFQAKPAEPPIGQIEIDFLAKTPFRANAEPITNDLPADHEVWIDGWATQVAVKWSQMGAQFAQINKPINLAQQMIARDPILQAKLIKQLRLIGL